MWKYLYKSYNIFPGKYGILKNLSVITNVSGHVLLQVGNYGIFFTMHFGSKNKKQGKRDHKCIWKIIMTNHDMHFVQWWRSGYNLEYTGIDCQRKLTSEE